MAVLAVGCGSGKPDRRTLLAQTWTCEMTIEANGLTSRYRETVSLRPSGDYQTKATIVATNESVDATMNLEWTGRWRLSGDAFERDFLGIKAISGETRGEPMDQVLLDRAADAFRSAPTSERGTISELTEHLLVIDTNSAPLTCKR